MKSSVTPRYHGSARRKEGCDLAAAAITNQCAGASLGAPGSTPGWHRLIKGSPVRIYVTREGAFPCLREPFRSKVRIRLIRFNVKKENQPDG